MKLDYDLIEDICLFKYNHMIDSPQRVNLRDARMSSDGDGIIATCAIGESAKDGMRARPAMEEFYIKTEEYSRLLREKKLKDIGI